MWIEITKAVLGLTVLLGGWLLVQLAWRRVFRGGAPDVDALAGRGCHSCTCEEPCDDAKARQSTSIEQERRHAPTGL